MSAFVAELDQNYHLGEKLGGTRRYIKHFYNHFYFVYYFVFILYFLYFYWRR